MWDGQFQLCSPVFCQLRFQVSVSTGDPLSVEWGLRFVKPFLAETHIPYRMVLGNDAVAQQYGIESMPDTFLIDRQGRIAAAYRAGLVDRENIEENIKTLLVESQK